MTAVVFGAALGGGLGFQGQRLQALAVGLQRIVVSPALGQDAPAPRAAFNTDYLSLNEGDRLDQALSEPWPADRMLIAHEPSPPPRASSPKPVAAPLSWRKAPFISIVKDWRRHLAGISLPSFLVAAPEESAAGAAAESSSQPTQSRPEARSGLSNNLAVASRSQTAKASSAPIDYGAQAQNAVLNAGRGSVMNFMGGGRRR